MFEFPRRMLTPWSPSRLFLVMVLGFVAGTTTSAGIDVKVQVDKQFDFSSVRTWAWNPAGAGEVKMARTPDDDPDAMRRRAEPIIVDAVVMELGKRGLQQAVESSDVVVTYYLLLSIGSTAQTLGQFVPTVPDWGLPPLTGATQSLEIVQTGSLVLDLAAKGAVVWRGVAQAKISLDSPEGRRETLLRNAVRDLVRKYPRR